LKVAFDHSHWRLPAGKAITQQETAVLSAYNLLMEV